MRTSDPDHSRVRLAASGTLTTGLTSLVLFSLVKPLHLNPSTALLGASLSLMSCITVNDPTRRATLGTYAFLTMPIIVGILASSAFGSRPLWSLIAFLLIVFAAVLGRGIGARGVAIGMIAFHAFVVGSFFRGSPAEVPARIGAALVGLAVACLVRVVLLPERPERSLTAMVRSLPRLASLVLAMQADLTRSGAWDGYRRKWLRKLLRRLNEGVLVLEDHLDRSRIGAREELRRQVLDIEVSVARAVSGALSLQQEPDATRELRFALADAFEVASLAVTGDTRLMARCHELLREASATAVGRRGLLLTVRRIGAAFDDLVAALQSMRASTKEPLRLVMPRTNTAAETQARTIDFRHAFQVALACALAMTIGRWISKDRWFWAALAAFVVVAPASSRGEIMVRAWRRTLGTILGLTAGMWLATLVIGHPYWELVLLFVSVFCGVYWYRYAYSVMVLFFTLAVAIMYGLTGRYSLEILEIRLEETVAGAAVGAITAAFILPKRTRSLVRTSLEQTLSALADCLERLASGAGTERVLAAIRELDRRLRALRAAAEPLTRGLRQLTQPTVELVNGASMLSFYVRQLATPQLLPVVARVAGTKFNDVLGSLSQDARAIRTTLNEERADTPLTTPTRIPALRAEVEAAEPDPDLDLTFLCVERMNSTMVRMAKDSLGGGARSAHRADASRGGHEPAKEDQASGPGMDVQIR